MLVVLSALLLPGMLLSISEAGLEKNEKAGTPVVAPGAEQDRLAVLWTSGDPDVAKKMVFLYTYNAKKYKWFNEIKFIIWGASTKLLSEDRELQDQLVKMRKIGIKLYACKWCSDSYGVSDQLKKLGVNVIYYGKPLSRLIKDDWKILTF